MRTESNYRWKSRPLFCKLGWHSSSLMEDYVQIEGVWVRRCHRCPYYWYS